MDSTSAARPKAPVGFYLFIAFIVVFAAGKAVLYDTMDPDCFWHLRVADQLLHEGIHPLVDHLSFSSSPQPWTPYSWLAELFMKVVWDYSSYRGAVAVQALSQGAILLFIALASLNLQLYKKSGTGPRYIPVIVATAAYAYLSLAYFSFRPVTFAFVFLSACTWIIVRDRRLDERSKAIWLIIPFTAVLTNIHLFSFFIPAVVFAMLCGSIIEQLQTGEKSKPDPVRRYSLLLWGTTAAFFATPMVTGLFKTIFYYSAKDQMVASPFIEEMQSFARGTMGHIAAVVVAGILASAVFNRHRLRAGEIICLIVGTILLFKLGRFCPIFAMIACPVFATTVPKLRDGPLTNPVLKYVMFVVVGYLLVNLAVKFPKHQTFDQWLNRHGAESPGYPSAAADYVLGNVSPVHNKIINEFSWGGYLEWHLQGHYQVFLDGRTQVFPSQFWHDTYLGSDAERKNFLATVPADAALLPKEHSTFAPALTQLGWTTGYKDDRAIVLLPPAAVTQSMSKSD